LQDKVSQRQLDVSGHEQLRPSRTPPLLYLVLMWSFPDLVAPELFGFDGDIDHVLGGRKRHRVWLTAAPQFPNDGRGEAPIAPAQTASGRAEAVA
jgi:hypothetical protein